ncbi:MAG: tRNA glutamyl-Q(34) synthetase GluQRS [Chromatiales bacterium]|nr:tRNA glutamyl-Q(34) synthetase GluQRS [Chromatiales bacterium]
MKSASVNAAEHAPTAAPAAERKPSAPPRPVRGRFAPSPTGDLHFGSLLAALASFLSARAAGGEWQLRIEDLDTARCVPGATDRQLAALERLGLRWDGPVRQQSADLSPYREALAQLLASGDAFPCACSRADLAAGGDAGPAGARYPGTCRNGLPAGRAARSVRARVDATPIEFTDRFQGPIRTRLDRTGDFVIHRADGVIAYQLAVTVDDARQGITEVVRGADLLDSTPRQIWLARRLGLAVPEYAHIPVATTAGGRKLGKRDADRPIADAEPVSALLAGLEFLGQPLPEQRPERADELLAWAIARFDPTRIPRRRYLPVAERWRGSP